MSSFDSGPRRQEAAPKHVVESRPTDEERARAQTLRAEALERGGPEAQRIKEAQAEVLTAETEPEKPPELTTKEIRQEAEHDGQRAYFENIHRFENDPEGLEDYKNQLLETLEIVDANISDLEKRDKRNVAMESVGWDLRLDDALRSVIQYETELNMIKAHQEKMAQKAKKTGELLRQAHAAYEEPLQREAA